MNRPFIYVLLVGFSLTAACGYSNQQVSAPTQSTAIKRLDGSHITADELTARIEALTRAAEVQGLVVAVFNENSPVYQRAFGFADQPNAKPLKLTTEIYGASLSKAVFAVLVMQLVDEGVLGLDEPLQNYLDEPLCENTGSDWHEDLTALCDDPRYREITARMSLAHTTGMPGWRWFEPDRKLRIKFAPGDRYFYSGEGMVFLQIALEKMTGKKLEQLMDQYIFKPFGMGMSAYSWRPRFEADYALGHRSDGSTYPKDKDNSPRAPSTLETTPDDYIRFLEAVMQGKGLSQNAKGEMFSPQIRIQTKTQFGPGATEFSDATDDIELSYGLGWGLLKSPHGWGAFKEGHGNGFQHYSIIFPDTGIGVLLMSNSDNAESVFAYLLKASIADTWTPIQWQNYIPYDSE